MSDERREVARRLLECRRDAREYDDREADVALAPKLVMKNGNSMYRNVAGSLEEGGNFSLGYEQAIYRLADLIDPTCHVFVCGHPDKHHVCRTCDKCSFGWYEDVHEERFRFCPNCGRRFVGGGGEDA